MFSTAFVKTYEVYEVGSEAKKTQADPEERIRDNENDNEVDEPEERRAEICYPEKAIVYVVNVDIGVSGLEDPLFFLWNLIKFDPPPQPCKLFAEDIFIDPEIDGNEQSDKNKI